jgi:tRNA (mo5U34)-methyltransferase
MQRGAADIEPLQRDYDFWTEGLFDGPGYPKLHFVEHKFAQDWTNWWIPNRACVEAMLRSAGFAVTAHPEQEVYICRRVERPYGAGAVYPAKGTHDRSGNDLERAQQQVALGS